MGNLTLSTNWYNWLWVVIGFGTAVEAVYLLINKWLGHKMRHALEDLQTIKHEVTPNSGTSIKDKVEITTLRLERVEAQVERVEAQLDAIMKILMERHG